MFELAAWLLNHQFLSVLISSLLGVLSVLALIKTPNQKRTWKVADLIWIFTGGGAALTALTASLFLSEVNEIQRRIGGFVSQTRSFNKDVMLFQSVNCNNDNPSNRLQYAVDSVDSIEVVCRNTHSMMVSTRQDSDLLRFASLFSKDGRKASEPDVIDLNVTGFEEVFDTIKEGATPEQLKGLGIEFRSFFPSGGDSQTDVNTALRVLSLTGFHNKFIAEYQVIASTYRDLKASFTTLDSMWSEAAQRRLFLVIRLFSLCLVAFVFPLRVYKSIFEIRQVS
ncbi:MAG: hypothetical protein ACRBBS_11165 [Thalassovita sp.]